jgi:hypothetical protein
MSVAILRLLKTSF